MHALPPPRLNGECCGALNPTALCGLNNINKSEERLIFKHSTISPVVLYSTIRTRSTYLHSCVCSGMSGIMRNQLNDSGAFLHGLQSATVE